MWWVGDAILWLRTVCNVQRPSESASWQMTSQLTQHLAALRLNASSRSCEHLWCPWCHGGFHLAGNNFHGNYTGNWGTSPIFEVMECIFGA